MKLFIQVCFGKTIKTEIDISSSVLSATYRIRFGFQMSLVAIAEDHAVYADLSLPVDTAFCCDGCSGNSFAISFYTCITDSKIETFKEFLHLGIDTARVL